MDLPIELFLSFIAFAVVMGIIGLWKRIPIMMFIAGAVITFWAITTDTIILGFEQVTDSSQIQESTIGNSTTYAMVFEASNTDGIMFNATGGNHARGELINTASSTMIGKNIQCVDLLLRKVGNPTGNALIELSITSTTNTVILIGDQGFADLNSTDTWYTYCLPEGQEQIMGLGETIGLRITSTSFTNSTNYIVWRYQSTGGFDGSNTRAVLAPFGSNTWTTAGVVNADMTMRVYDQVPVVVLTEDFFSSVEPNEYEFTEYPKILFGLIASIFMIAGALVWKYEEN